MPVMALMMMVMAWELEHLHGVGRNCLTNKTRLDRAGLEAVALFQFSEFLKIHDSPNVDLT